MGSVGGVGVKTTAIGADSRWGYASAAAVALAAVALQWLIVPGVGVRIPFLFFLVATGVVSFYFGRGPGVLVLIAGAVNSAFLFAPQGHIAIDSWTDRAVVAIYMTAGSALVYLGARARALYQSSETNLRDLQALHSLSATLATIRTLPDQLHLILVRFADLHGAQHGLVSIFDRSTNQLSVAASFGFSAWALDRLVNVQAGEGACGLACLERRRVVIEDTERDPAFASYRELARHEGFRAVHSTPLLSPDGEVLGALSVHFTAATQPSPREIRLAEICARKAAVHVARAQAEAIARESDQRLRLVVEASAVPFAMLAPVRDDAGSIVDFSWTYLNESAMAVLRRPASELLGKQVAEVLPATWDQPGLFEHYLAVALRGEVRRFELDSHVNGIEGWFEVVASPVAGNVAVWFADVTARKRQELQLLDADRRKDEFLATLAHELRNPLAPIRQAAMLARNPNVPAAKREWCNEVIDRQVQHMSLLLDDLLDVSRITRGILQLRKQPTSLSALIESAVETVRPSLDSKSHTLRVQVDCADTTLFVDSLRMSQVIANVLNNAAKYTNPGGTICLTAATAGSSVTLSISDNGMGIAPEHLDSIFEMFAQVNSTQERSEGGLGIGLALAKGLVELHGGSIQAQSPGPGRGSTFTIHLRDAVHGGAGAQPHLARPKPVLCRRVLLADDNRDAAQSLAMLLSMEGHDVTVVHDGAAALAAFDQVNPDVALLDLGMPKRSGFDVAKDVRASPAHSAVILIAITGWGQAADRARAATVGFDHHLVKPVDPEALLELIDGLDQDKLRKVV